MLILLLCCSKNTYLSPLALKVVLEEIASRSHLENLKDRTLCIGHALLTLRLSGFFLGNRRAGKGIIALRASNRLLATMC